MKPGTLYGIGVGPGDPDLITVKGAKILAGVRHVFVPRARNGSESTALEIARPHIRPDAEIHPLIFPMTSDSLELRERWAVAARSVAQVLETGEDACFLTLGDALLYSTYIYMLRALRERLPQVNVVTVPGISAFSAAAALTEFPLGQAKEPVSIVPTSDDLDAVRRAVSTRGAVVLMKVGKRLQKVLDLLEEEGRLSDAVFVSRAGMAAQRIETDLRKLRGTDMETGYLSIILVHASPETV